jgi:hypothetical protein
VNENVGTPAISQKISDIFWRAYNISTVLQCFHIMNSLDPGKYQNYGKCAVLHLPDNKHCQFVGINPIRPLHYISL